MGTLGARLKAAIPSRSTAGECWCNMAIFSAGLNCVNNCSGLLPDCSLLAGSWLAGSGAGVVMVTG
ncbi:hypothetical protein NHF46_19885 [Arthrobacter alpinus]|nr:hypothetical protein [Arthrobacter alpinus]